MVRIEKRVKKNVTDTEMNVIFGDVTMKENSFFSSISSGVTGTSKLATCNEVTNVISSVQTMQEIRLKLINVIEMLYIYICNCVLTEEKSVSDSSIFQMYANWTVAQDKSVMPSHPSHHV